MNPPSTTAESLDISVSFISGTQVPLPSAIILKRQRLINVVKNKSRANPAMCETRSNFSGLKQQDITYQEGSFIINLLYRASLCITKHFKQRRRRLIRMVIQRTLLRGCNSAWVESCTSPAQLQSTCSSSVWV